MTDYWNANTINDLIRSIFAFLDKVAYWLLGIMYEILFNVASADLFSNETIKNFYGRVQLIIGVFMIFKLAVSIIQGIVNPDTFTDKKSGFSSIITRIVFALVMLVVLTPISIPGAKNEYEIQINNNGLLFGTLYSLQNRILQNNTLGRLILGTTDTATSSTSDPTLSGADKQAEKLKQSADIFTSTILKGFVRINLKEDGTDETNPDHRVCSYIDQNTLNAYTALDASPNEILSLVNASCEYQGGGFSDILGTFKRLAGKDRYVFAYMPVVSTAVAVVFIYILLGEIITIAIRSVKLAVLRLIAPIPIISYIDPKSAKDGAFASWVKALTSTYIELFLHLAVIYFVIYLIQDMIVNGIVINTGTGIIGIISMIFIWIGLFFFIKQAPKFIKDVLGVKGNTGNLGLTGLLAATGALRQHGTLHEAGEAFRDSTRAYTDAYNQGKGGTPIGAAYDFGRDHVAKILTGDNNMTGRMMSRGERHLNRMGINSIEANRLKGISKADEEKANKAADLYDRFNKGPGHYTEAEISSILGTDYDAADSDDVKRTKLYDKKVALAKQAGSSKGDYEDVKGMQKKYGQARSYEAQYEARARNRSVGGLWRDSEHSSFQAWRTQKYPETGRGTSAETPRDSGAPDLTGPGATTPGGGHIGHHGGPPPRP